MYCFTKDLNLISFQLFFSHYYVTVLHVLVTSTTVIVVSLFVSIVGICLYLLGIRLIIFISNLLYLILLHFGSFSISYSFVSLYQTTLFSFFFKLYGSDELSDDVKKVISLCTSFFSLVEIFDQSFRFFMKKGKDCGCILFFYSFKNSCRMEKQDEFLSNFHYWRFKIYESVDLPSSKESCITAVLLVIIKHLAIINFP